jgi:hypothetical protein
VVVVPEETNLAGRSVFSFGRANIDTSNKISLEKLTELAGVEATATESVAAEAVTVSTSTETIVATEAPSVIVAEPVAAVAVAAEVAEVAEEVSADEAEEAPAAVTENERLEGLLSVDWENLHTLKMAELATIGGYFDPPVARRHTKDETVSDLLDAARTAGLL